MKYGLLEQMTGFEPATLTFLEVSLFTTASLLERCAPKSVSQYWRDLISLVLGFSNRDLSTI